MLCDIPDGRSLKALIEAAFEIGSAQDLDRDFTAR
jgi:hypothetical protein